MGVDPKQLLDLGRSYPEGENQPFSLTALALPFSRSSNGVSKLHSDVATHMWHHLFPDQTVEDEPIQHITNGVHVSTWLGHDIRTLIEDEWGSDWQNHLTDSAYWETVRTLKDDDLWQAHHNQKERLIKLVRSRLVEQFARHGKSPDEMREVAHMLDPHVLTIGFARRFATYKRAGLIFQDYQQLKSIITCAHRPVHIIFSGKAHPADVPGQDIVKKIVNIASQSDLKGYIFFLENYEMRIARHLVQGVDVWLNTPRRPREASGTSGMKAAMNGALNLSIADGWWPEAYTKKNGWLIGGGREFDNEEMQDYEDVASFYDILDNQVIPLYYENRKKGIPIKWMEAMKESMATIIPSFSAARTLKDYLTNSYKLR
ncbi:MAG: alpha-glucan family phosphorylase [Kiritimatiellae bacterium]|nr:alpha-glucan family phosphorylase [Kiritimatiellia bacterium]